MPTERRDDDDSSSQMNNKLPKTFLFVNTNERPERQEMRCAIMPMRKAKVKAKVINFQ